MKIAMFTNTYLPHVGGVAHSVERFARAYRAMGHEVLVVAPTFPELDPDHDEADVVRVPAIQQFNGSDFSVRLPIPGLLTAALDRFEPDIIHAHHPFLLGDTALRTAAWREAPLVFTHHTLYERYTHYVPADSQPLRRFAISLAVEYCGLCDHVIAPSESIADILRQRDVAAPITVIPTGVDTQRFASGDRRRWREQLGIDPATTVIGHVGRLAPEKSLEYLARCCGRFMADRPDTALLIVGDGPSTQQIRRIANVCGVGDRTHLPGSLTGRDLVDAYHAMDLFAIASTSETQGMVVAEAMAVGLPVVGVDASGVREVVQDRINGRLVAEGDEPAFIDALAWTVDADAERAASLKAAAQRTAEELSLSRTAEQALALYQTLLGRRRRERAASHGWDKLLSRIEAEWNLLASRMAAAADAFRK